MSTESFFVGKFDQLNLKVTYTTKNWPENGLKAYDKAKPSEAPFSKVFPFPLTSVQHSTHTKEKKSICIAGDGCARFEANPKNKSQSCTTFQKICMGRDNTRLGKAYYTACRNFTRDVRMVFHEANTARRP